MGSVSRLELENFFLQSKSCASTHLRCSLSQNDLTVRSPASCSFSERSGSCSFLTHTFLHSNIPTATIWKPRFLICFQAFANCSSSSGFMSVTDTLSVTGRPRVTIKEQRVFDTVAPPKDESVLCSNCYFVAAQVSRWHTNTVKPSMRCEQCVSRWQESGRRDEDLYSGYCEHTCTLTC